MKKLAKQGYNEVKIMLKQAWQPSDELITDCSNCFGLCCVALYFSKMDGFPSDKPSGKACPHLDEAFRCHVHQELNQRGYKGCMGYDCIGAGQKISQHIFKGLDWRKNPSIKREMFDLLPLVQQLHELLWYLKDAQAFEMTKPLHQSLQKMYDDILILTTREPRELAQLDLNTYRGQVNELLIACSELVREEALRGVTSGATQKNIERGANFMGANMRKLNLVGANLRGAFLIAANLQGCDLRGADMIGADMRDANILDADLSQTLFLTQGQLNVAKGNQQTKIPSHLTRPSQWLK